MNSGEVAWALALGEGGHPVGHRQYYVGRRMVVWPLTALALGEEGPPVGHRQSAASSGIVAWALALGEGDHLVV